MTPTLIGKMGGSICHSDLWAEVISYSYYKSRYMYIHFCSYEQSFMDDRINIGVVVVVLCRYQLDFLPDVLSLGIEGRNGEVNIIDPSIQPSLCLFFFFSSTSTTSSSHFDLPISSKSSPHQSQCCLFAQLHAPCLALSPDPPPSPPGPLLCDLFRQSPSLLLACSSRHGSRLQDPRMRLSQPLESLGILLLKVRQK